MGGRRGVGRTGSGGDRRLKEGFDSPIYLRAKFGATHISMSISGDSRHVSLNGVRSLMDWGWITVGECETGERGSAVMRRSSKTKAVGWGGFRAASAPT
jgi:hypothetical protein